MMVAKISGLMSCHSTSSSVWVRGGREGGRGGGRERGREGEGREGGREGLRTENLSNSRAAVSYLGNGDKLRSQEDSLDSVDPKQLSGQRRATGGDGGGEVDGARLEDRHTWNKFEAVGVGCVLDSDEHGAHCGRGREGGREGGCVHVCCT